MIYLSKLESKHISISSTVTNTNRRAALLIAFTSGVACMGDAFLYAYLPVHGKEIGLSVFAIGVILSINRFSRLVTNGWVAWISNKIGLKKIILISILLTALSTYFYGQNMIIFYWIVLRILWGIAFSAFRLSYMRFSHLSSRPSGTMGLGKSFQEIGPLLVYWFGPFFLYLLGPELLFTALTALSVLLIPIVFFLPSDLGVNQHVSLFKISKPQHVDYWAFLTAFTETAIVVGLSNLLSFNDGQVISMLGSVAIYISIKRVLSVLISPFIGRVSDKIGLNKLFHFSGLGMFFSVLLVILNLSEIGVILFFLFLNINLVCLPLIAIQNTEETGIYRRLTNTNTSRDLGLSVGALVTLPLLNIIHPSIIFSVTLVLMILSYLQILNRCTTIAKKPE